MISLDPSREALEYFHSIDKSYNNITSEESHHINMNSSTSNN